MVLSTTRTEGRLNTQGDFTLTKRNLLAAFLVSVIFCPIAKADEVDNWLASYESPRSLALKKIELRKNDNSGGSKSHSGGFVNVELFTTFNDGHQPEFIRQQMETPQK